MSSGFSIFSPNYLLHQLTSPNNTFAESYQKIEEFVEKPRKRIRQRVDAGLPRNAYSKNSNTANPISNPFRIESDAKMNLNLIEQLQNRSQSSFGNLASSYFANPYLHTFLRLQQLKQSNLHNLTNGEIKIQELADDETENEYESNRKRAKTNRVECILNKIHNDEGPSPGHNKEVSPGASDQKNPSNDQDDRNETNSVGNLTDASSQSEPVRMDQGHNPSTSVVPKPSPMDQVREPEVPTELKDLADKLKSELMQTLSDTVDKIVSQFLEDETVVSRPPTVFQAPPPEGTMTMIQGYPQLIQAPAYQSIFPSYSRPHQSSLCSLNVLANKNKNDQNGSLSMIFGRKRRTKVTDTRVNRLSLKSDSDGIRSSNGPNGFHFPTMVPQTPKWSHEGSEYSSNSPENFETEGVDFDTSNYQSSTLTPMHLRKAKLIFFYARYPTSALLKAYFPDIRFHKNNTAQLVKWFSNFREYYYIQMEKYARQALAEGVKKAEDIHISADCELYRSLIQHYSRNNNYIQVPLNFRPVVESTLREFFMALQSNRDLEPSWKKSIYKVIARMDEHIPEYFKTANFLEQLK